MGFLLRAAILACVLMPPVAAHAEKVLRYAFLVAETGFDPAQISDLYSATLVSNMFDAPYATEFLARPVTF